MRKLSMVRLSFLSGFIASTLLLTASPAIANEHLDDHKDVELQRALIELDKFVSQKAASDEFSGTVLFAKGDTILYTAAHGLASRRFNAPINLQTKMNWGSISKMFTSTAILQLVEQDKIRLEDTLDQYLDESWLKHPARSDIQIQHLLTHASGLSSYFTDDFFNGSKQLFRELSDYKPLIVDDVPAFEPGSGYKYSNTGMLLLGAVIEKVTGENYFTYMESQIYRPTGMMNTGCYASDEPVQNVAIGYYEPEDNPGVWRNNFFWKPIKGSPAGGCFSNVEDLHTFALALTGFKLLTEETTHLMLTPKSEFHSEPYGFGVRIQGTTENPILGHRGGFVGISANLDIFANSGFIAAALSNRGGGTWEVNDKIREIVDRLTKPEPSSK
jgi:CubicO group peptidase (beta-lactamase class C family)